MTINRIASNKKIQAEQIAKITAGKLIGNNSFLKLNGYTIASFAVESGDLFIALPGEKQNGWDFAFEACERGAAAILTEKALPEIKIPQILVPSTLEALTNWARKNRQESNAVFIAITGSSGKTTTKEMTRAILEESQIPFFCNPGNLNSQVGAPFSMLGLTLQEKIALLEIGMSSPGEIANLTKLINPSIALITNIGHAHLKNFQNTEGITNAKGELIKEMDPSGTLFLNRDNKHYLQLCGFSNKQSLFDFSISNPSAYLYAGNIETSLEKSSFDLYRAGQYLDRVSIEISGRSNISNALAAIGIISAIGIDHAVAIEGLKKFRPVAQRSMLLKLPLWKSYLLDDTYNAGFESVLEALKIVQLERDRTPIFIFGDMLELGLSSEKLHSAIGIQVAKNRMKIFLTYGKMSNFSQRAFQKNYHQGIGRHFSALEELNNFLREINLSFSVILVKGSRSMKMEQVVKRIISIYDQNTGDQSFIPNIE